MRYSFDTSALIEGNKLYPINIFPKLWENIGELINDGSIRAIAQVGTELGKKDDEISQWTSNYPTLFVPLEPRIQVIVTAIMDAHPNLVKIASGKSAADPFVIALAEVNSCTVVTYENRRSLLNPRIPDVCSARSIKVINLLDLVKAHGWSFS